MTILPRTTSIPPLPDNAPEEAAAADWRLAWLLERPGPPGHGDAAVPAEPAAAAPPPPTWPLLAAALPQEPSWQEAGLPEAEAPPPPAPPPTQPDAAAPPPASAPPPGPGPASLGGRVFVDADGNGLQDPGEAGVAGRLVTLLDAAGDSTGRAAVTDADGLFRFEGLAAGTYRLAFAPQAAQPFSPLGDSDADPRSGVTAPLALAAGEAGRLDAGVFTPAALGGHAWQDLDGDGSRAAGEAALSGAGVRLLDATGRVLAATRTDAEGAWRFSGLAPDFYRVEIASGEGALEPSWRSGLLRLDSGGILDDLETGLAPQAGWPAGPACSPDAEAAELASRWAALHAMLAAELVL
ncbi:SdrD B-like domain-containing protein [Falsiroseomonas sp.]|uniref:SdrD B-like domain-containing protein n=1 Tax=Falsiroseomonas sp. TaxID=2870721 RepID=UPI003F6F9E52